MANRLDATLAQESGVAFAGGAERERRALRRAGCQMRRHHRPLRVDKYRNSVAHSDTAQRFDRRGSLTSSTFAAVAQSRCCCPGEHAYVHGARLPGYAQSSLTNSSPATASSRVGRVADHPLRRHQNPPRSIWAQKTRGLATQCASVSNQRTTITCLDAAARSTLAQSCASSTQDVKARGGSPSRFPDPCPWA